LHTLLQTRRQIQADNERDAINNVKRRKQKSAHTSWTWKNTSPRTWKRCWTWKKRHRDHSIGFIFVAVLLYRRDSTCWTSKNKLKIRPNWLQKTFVFLLLKWQTHNLEWWQNKKHV
jgi:hypothetical protein